MSPASMPPHQQLARCVAPALARLGGEAHKWAIVADVIAHEPFPREWLDEPAHSASMRPQVPNGLELEYRLSWAISDARSNGDVEPVPGRRGYWRQAP